MSSTMGTRFGSIEASGAVGRGEMKIDDRLILIRGVRSSVESLIRAHSRDMAVCAARLRGGLVGSCLPLRGTEKQFLARGLTRSARPDQPTTARGRSYFLSSDRR
jgi:hypothetical protein